MIAWCLGFGVFSLVNAIVYGCKHEFFWMSIHAGLATYQFVTAASINLGGDGL